MENKKPLWRRKYVWLPLLLAIYFVFMAIYFGRDLIVAGKLPTFLLIASGEIVILVLLVIFLKKREGNKY